MILLESIIDNNSSLLTVQFNVAVLRHLQSKVNDNLLLFQCGFNKRHFILVKADNGYKIRRVPNVKKLYQINIKHRFDLQYEHSLSECIYFKKKNGTIRLKF